MNGIPYVIRGEQTFIAYEGLVLIDGDEIYDESGAGENFLPANTIVIDPNSELYKRILRMLNEDNSFY